ncbi:hypothetical protein QTH87_05685 [Variovorax sp. J22P168]|uniref:hypothetical protein n=1 Tax=Variovorax jilinensis TaxID=3053513 RepID=UPI0025780932|nr:hypothetical protein [Variovorax sp. J22P168]MDM0011928.1 hypothetical protein [Variovorax sp. J22P168]
MKKLTCIASVAAVLLLGAGCTDMTPRQQGTLSGAGMGALGGAGIAAISGGDAWTGAAIGGLAGGVAGNIHGGRQQPRW